MKKTSLLPPVVSFIACFILTCSFPTSATAKSSAIVDSNETMTTVDFITGSGVIRLNLPNEIRCGDTISGIIQIEGRGKSSRYEKKLNEYVLKIGEYEAYVRLGSYRLTIPKDATSLPVTLLNSKGSERGSAQIDVISSADKPSSEGYSSPACVEANKPIKVEGTFSGDFRITNVTTNGRPALILTESPRVMVFQTPDNIIGAMKVEVKQGDWKYKSELNALSISSTMVTRKIERGKSHSLLVRISGMKPDGPSVMVKLTNLTPGVVNLEGGDVQSIGAKSDTGTWEVRREVHGARAGRFRLKAHLIPSVKKVKFKAM